MGQILSQPVTEKESESNQNKNLAYGLSSMQGWRISMEDAHSTILNLHNYSNDENKTDDDNDDKTSTTTTKDKNSSIDPVAFFGVYDGHGGDRIAKYTGENLYKLIPKEPEFIKGNYGKALQNVFLSTDRQILQDDELKTDQSGCTATTVLIDSEKVVCANSGDSRTVLSVNGFAKPLSYDHKPNNEGEHARICAAGGFVDIGRVNGNLALSRAIGDFEFKKSFDLPPEEQIVTAFPDIIEHNLTKDDEFVVLACDGIWDCLSSQQVVEVVRKGIHLRKSLVEISEALIDICLAPSSGGSGIGCDNMSIVIVALLQGQTLEEWYESIISKGGPISEDFETVANEIYSEEERSQAIQQSTHEENVVGTDELKSSFSIQQLLENNLLTSQNGVLYLDSSNILSSLGVDKSQIGEGEGEGEDSEEGVETNEDGSKSGPVTELKDDEDDEEQSSKPTSSGSSGSNE
ncbi:hypothetical protein BN7_1565 [Wickerhamomyces ciferrii]|uniref:protein-serine/threonine phosphatase n=1 Tax=Wickerhamomyces ciferrii (strain ATCC 14091 / BCRC 22168 / CBS 111 / JCM 3599 / NBRC 0793 / NRRL Y-1031 F-60-10) TaxID=1206466 RepID=K0KGD6_WICCF|nr:uncharacterized protein BN7_1565 [Wickerhamomyces ciferrii]CCH42026.1 hypothetical protein BN7_1565 [Wickerhamomyces ciferrii]